MRSALIIARSCACGRASGWRRAPGQEPLDTCAYQSGFPARADSHSPRLAQAVFVPREGGLHRFLQRLVRRTAEIPGVRDAAAANTVPLSVNIPSIPVAVEGHPYVPAEHTTPMFWAGAVTPEYFPVMHIPILQGRELANSDAEKSELVVIVSAAMARSYWPGENPIGKTSRVVFRTTGGQWFG